MSNKNAAQGGRNSDPDILGGRSLTTIQPLPGTIGAQRQSIENTAPPKPDPGLAKAEGAADKALQDANAANLTLHAQKEMERVKDTVYKERIAALQQELKASKAPTTTATVAPIMAERMEKAMSKLAAVALVKGGAFLKEHFGKQPKGPGFRGSSAPQAQQAMRNVAGPGNQHLVNQVNQRYAPPAAKQNGWGPTKYDTDMDAGRNAVRQFNRATGINQPAPDPNNPAEVESARIHAANKAKIEAPNGPGWQPVLGGGGVIKHGPTNQGNLMAAQRNFQAWQQANPGQAVPDAMLQGAKNLAQTYGTTFDPSSGYGGVGQQPVYQNQVAAAPRLAPTTPAPTAPAVAVAPPAPTPGTPPAPAGAAAPPAPATPQAPATPATGRTFGELISGAGRALGGIFGQPTAGSYPPEVTAATEAARAGQNGTVVAPASAAPTSTPAPVEDPARAPRVDPGGAPLNWDQAIANAGAPPPVLPPGSPALPNPTIPDVPPVTLSTTQGGTTVGGTPLLPTTAAATTPAGAGEPSIGGSSTTSSTTSSSLGDEEPPPMPAPPPAQPVTLGQGMNPEDFTSPQDMRKSLGPETHLYSPEMKRRYKVLSGVDPATINEDGSGGGPARPDAAALEAPEYERLRAMTRLPLAGLNPARGVLDLAKVVTTPGAGEELGEFAQNPMGYYEKNNPGLKSYVIDPLRKVPIVGNGIDAGTNLAAAAMNLGRAAKGQEGAWDMAKAQALGGAGNFAMGALNTAAWGGKIPFLGGAGATGRGGQSAFGHIKNLFSRAPAAAAPAQNAIQSLASRVGAVRAGTPVAAQAAQTAAQAAQTAAPGILSRVGAPAMTAGAMSAIPRMGFENSSPTDGSNAFMQWMQAPERQDYYEETDPQRRMDYRDYGSFEPFSEKSGAAAPATSPIRGATGNPAYAHNANLYGRYAAQGIAGPLSKPVGGRGLLPDLVSMIGHGLGLWRPNVEENFTGARALRNQPLTEAAQGMQLAMREALPALYGGRTPSLQTSPAYQAPSLVSYGR